MIFIKSGMKHEVAATRDAMCGVRVGQVKGQGTLVDKKLLYRQEANLGHRLSVVDVIFQAKYVSVFVYY